MIKITVPVVPSKDDLFKVLSADLSHTYEVYFFGFKLSKVSMIKKSPSVAVIILPQPKKKRIVVYGSFPSTLRAHLFGGILPYLFVRKQWKAFETEIADYIQKKYNGTIGS